MESGRSRRSDTLLAFVLLFFAFVIRAWAIDQARFTGDESHYWATSRRLATLEEIPVYGPPITGSAANLPGPLYYYLMAVPQRLGASPRIGSAFVVLMHVLAAWLFFRLARSGRGTEEAERAGLFALALTAFAPWEVLYADRIWGSCVVPVFGAVGIYAAIASKDRPAWQGVLLFVSLVLPQLHMSTPLLWVTCAAILLLRPPERWSWRSLGLGLLASVLCYAHPMIREFATGFSNTRTILSEAGGKEPWSEMPPVALRVFGYAWLYATSEIGYHFDRGYWGGNFSDVFGYGPGAWRRWFELHGPVFGVANVVSMLLGLAAWVVACTITARRAIAALRNRRRADLEIGDVLTISLLAGVAAGAALLFLSRKKFFPHYANILMPMLLWPAADGIGALWSRWRPRKGLVIALGAALAVSIIAMLSSTIRYYRQVDSLNGLGPTLGMVEAVLGEERAVEVSFDHFHNGYAWGQISSVMHGREISNPRTGGPPVRYRVHNAAPFSGAAAPENAKLFGPVLLERFAPPDEVDPPGLVLRAKRAWREARVEAIDPAGARRACGPAKDLPEGWCRFGDQPWQKYGLESMEVGGRAESLLFLHPIAGSTVRAAWAAPASATKGVLRYALSDAATRSGNQSPVEVRVLQGDREVGRATADNTPGIREQAFALDPSGPREVAIEIRAVQDGARVFGFDLMLTSGG